MKINQHTKISQLINENPAAINVIASINRHFEKLRNPILRKVLASRVTIADAARIGGTTVQVFYEKLSSLGFYSEGDDPVTACTPTSVPEFYMDLTIENTQELDVRNDIALGKDPFKTIMRVLAQMPEKTTLKLINSFEPLPLINLLKKKGYESFVVHKEPSLVFTFFKLTNTNDKLSNPDSLYSETNHEEIAGLMKSFGEKIITVDVRGLEMPMPMVTILKAIDTMPPDHMIHVLHSRTPVYLLPELNNRGFIYKIKTLSEEKVVILIYK